MLIMRRISILFAIIFLAWGCEHNLTTDTDFSVTVDESNSYRAGEPVRFNFEGEVDNIVFYSGEQGHEYIHKDRYDVPMDEVDSVALSLDIQARYGSAGAMEIYITKNFEGLKADDPASDRELMKTLYNNRMSGWKKLEYAEGASQVLTSHFYNGLDSFKENFTIAFHWCPKEYAVEKPEDDRQHPDDTLTYKDQRTYWVNGRLSVGMKNLPQTVLDLSQLEFNTVVMNDQVDDVYHKNAGNGSIILNNQSTASLVFQGVGAKDSLNYAIDAWAVSTPRPLNSIANDHGIVIKNQQNYMPFYEYTWNEPGTYHMTFVGTSSNYLDESIEVIEKTIVILENI